MTNEELQAHIEALRGPYLAGEIEEVDESDGSVNDPRKSWGGGICLFDAELSYRIKPRPREIFVHPDDLSEKEACAFKGCHKIEAHSLGGLHMIRFREVLE